MPNPQPIQMEQRRELKPCPFCGSSAPYMIGDELNRFVECASCGAKGPTAATVVTGIASAVERAHDAWNTRAAHSVMSARVAEQWQPIETAPKDGTPVIIGWHVYMEVRGISRARWVSAEFWADLEGGNPDDFVAGWYEPGYEDEICANVWMPLPEPPALAPHPKARNE